MDGQQIDWIKRNSSIFISGIVANFVFASGFSFARPLFVIGISGVVAALFYSINAYIISSDTRRVMLVLGAAIFLLEKIISIVAAFEMR